MCKRMIGLEVVRVVFYEKNEKFEVHYNDGHTRERDDYFMFSPMEQEFCLKAHWTVKGKVGSRIYEWA